MTDMMGVFRTFAAFIHPSASSRADRDLSVGNTQLALSVIETDDHGRKIAESTSNTWLFG
jgi:hypothetical protein